MARTRAAPTKADLDRATSAVRLVADRPYVPRQTIHACRKRGVVSVPGVYGGVVDKVPFGAAFAEGLTIKMDQSLAHRYLASLMERIQATEAEPSFIITLRVSFDEAPTMYQTFREKEDGCVRFVVNPEGAG